MRPLAIAAPLLLMIALCARGEDETVATESPKSFWKIAHTSETRLFLVHGACAQVVPLTDLHHELMRGFLVQDEAKKESLAAIQIAAPTKANRYYGWTEKQLQAKWGIPIGTLTIGCEIRVENERRRPARVIYTSGRRVDLCERNDWPGDSPEHQSYRLLVYQADDPDYATGFVFYGKHQTVGGGFFKGVPILSPKKKLLAEDDPRQVADLLRQKKEKAALLTFAPRKIKWPDNWAEEAQRINEANAAGHPAPVEDFGL